MALQVGLVEAEELLVEGLLGVVAVEVQEG
jgi:hypothetical protein